MTSNKPSISITLQNRTNGKTVYKVEHISAILVTVFYTDMTKRTMTAEDYRLMHKEVVAK